MEASEGVGVDISVLCPTPECGTCGCDFLDFLYILRYSYATARGAMMRQPAGHPAGFRRQPS